MKYGEAELAYKSIENLTEKPVLYNLFWETTLLCNAKCKHCGSRAGENCNIKDELTTKEIKKTLRSRKNSCSNYNINSRNSSNNKQQNVLNIKNNDSLNNNSIINNGIFYNGNTFKYPILKLDYYKKKKDFFLFLVFCNN